ncbi:ABC transporter substrate-binding protein [Microlunatus soli]|uniref:Iron complex transport system substrate-binding protein n=1 Tax=Microlunatus soli TaxID=630515 RepID=A0A1H1WJW8_9ACTN|nr:ABC transporter substrate-binding protein [Microlunatus soli]SDS97608.1 iron complex transport system substrate-binding protein [Microlunatus soli]
MINKLLHRTPGKAAMALVAIVTTLAATACGVVGSSPAPGVAPSSGSPGCISDFDPKTDYFGVKQKLEYATNFDISYHKSYQVITVQRPEVGGKPESYVLVKCGAPKPDLTGELAEAPQLSTPVHSLFSASTTHIPSLEALGQLDVLTGVASKSLINSAAARSRVAGDQVTEFAPAGTADAEKIVASQPDALITAGMDDPAYATVRKAGIPVLADAEYLERTPLGQAEWIKFFAALTGTEQRAAETFDTIAGDYRTAVNKAAKADPTEVLLSQPYQGVWTMPTGGTVMGKMITDAGGSWAWQSDTSPSSASPDLEQVFTKSGKAKIWITSTNWKTRKEALADEPRFAQLAAYKSGAIWAPSKQVNAAGGNNIFELGVLRPDLVVGDLIAITHPDLEPGHRFTFYRKLK